MRRAAYATGCALGISLASSACQSPALDGLRGARLYASGSEALEAGDAERAIDALEAAARLVPHASEIQNHLGLAYWQNEEFDRAAAAFDRAIELDCDNDAARVNRAQLLEANAAIPIGTGDAAGQEPVDSDMNAPQASSSGATRVAPSIQGNPP